MRFPSRVGRMSLLLSVIVCCLAVLVAAVSAVAENKKPEGWLANFGQPSSTVPDTYNAHFALGQELMQKNDLEGAAREFLEGMRLFQTYQVPSKRYGDYWGRLGWELYVQPLAEAAVNLGHSLRNTGRLDTAIKLYEKAADLAPWYAAAHESLGRARIEKARQLHERHARRRGVTPDDIQPYVTLSKAYGLAFGRTQPSVGHRFLQRSDEMEECRKAIWALYTARELEPESPSVRVALSEGLLRSGRYHAATREAQKAVELDPTDPDAHFHLALALLTTDKGQDAVDAYREAARLASAEPDERQAEIQNSLGVALAAVGAFDEALVAHRKAATLDPDGPEYQNNVAAMLRTTGSTPESVAAQLAATTLDPDTTEYYLNLAAAYRETASDQDLDSLRPVWAAYRQAVRRDLNNAEIHHQLGLTLYDSSNPLRAIDRCQTITASELGYGDIEEALAKVVMHFIWSQELQRINAMDPRCYQVIPRVALKPSKWPTLKKDLERLWERLDDYPLYGDARLQLQKAILDYPSIEAAVLRVMGRHEEVLKVKAAGPQEAAMPLDAVARVITIVGSPGKEGNLWCANCGEPIGEQFKDQEIRCPRCGKIWAFNPDTKVVTDKAVQKTCSNCGKRVSLWSRASMRCPHCRSLWVGETAVEKYCDMCDTALPLAVKQGDRCPSCGGLWDVATGVEMGHKNFTRGFRPYKKASEGAIAVIVQRCCSNCGKLARTPAKLGRPCPHCGAYWTSETDLKGFIPRLAFGGKLFAADVDPGKPDLKDVAGHAAEAAREAGAPPGKLVRASSKTSLSLPEPGAVGFADSDLKIGDPHTTQAAQRVCANCGEEVPLSCKVGMRCPHCGSVWSKETDLKDVKYEASLVLASCSHCGEAVSPSSKPGMRCTHCGALWVGRAELKDLPVRPSPIYSKACALCDKQVPLGSKVGMRCPHCHLEWLTENDLRVITFDESPLAASVAALPTETRRSAWAVGTVLRQDDELREAEAELEWAAKLYPNSPHILNNLGKVCQEMGDDKRALSKFNRALRILMAGQRRSKDTIPGDIAEIHFNAGVALARLGDMDQATEAWRNALDLGKNDARLWTYLGIAYLQNTELDHAYAYFKRAVKMDEDYAPAHYYVGLVEALRNTASPITRSALQNARVRTIVGEPHYDVRAEFIRSAALEPALDALRSADQADPERREFYYYVGVELGLQDPALSSVEGLDVIHSVPLGQGFMRDWAAVTNNIAVCAFLGGEVAKAENLLRIAVDDEPDYALAHWNLGRVLMAQNKEAEGKAELARAARLAKQQGLPYYFNIKQTPAPKPWRMPRMAAEEYSHKTLLEAFNYQGSVL